MGLNKQVTFSTAKLLKEKGYSWECENFYKKGKYDKKFYLTTGVEYDSDRNCIWDWNLNGGKSGMLSKVIPYPNERTAIYYSAPTIAEVVMWLYEKHKIWISVGGDCDYKFKFEIHTWKWYEPEKSYRLGHTVLGETFWDCRSEEFSSSTEAYEAVIEYTLNHLI